MEGNYSPRERERRRETEREEARTRRGNAHVRPPGAATAGGTEVLLLRGPFVPPQGLFLPLPLAPTLSPPYPPFLAPFSTYNAAVPFSQAPQALPTAANWKSPSRVACALLRASGRGSVGAPRARRAAPFAAGVRVAWIYQN